jgi:hypothetical protein
VGWLTQTKRTNWPKRAPQQVVAQIAEADAGFPIDRAGGFEELLAVAKPIMEESFVAIGLAAPAARLAGTPWGRREITSTFSQSRTKQRKSTVCLLWAKATIGGLLRD